MYYSKVLIDVKRLKKGAFLLFPVVMCRYMSYNISVKKRKVYKMKKFIATKTENVFVKVETYYNLGGMNYFTYKVELRGYYLSVTPVERINRGSYITESCTAFSGYKMLLKEVKRKSKKAEMEAEQIAADEMQRIIDQVLSEQGLELA